jgi:serine/threonine-protein kinase RsbW
MIRWLRGEWLAERRFNGWSRPKTAGEFDRHSELSSGKPDHPNLTELLPYLRERVVFNLPSELKYREQVLDYVNQRMIALGLVAAHDTDAVVALDEAIVNAIKHGNKCDPCKAIHVVAEFTEDGARFIVSDEGSGFRPDQLPDPTTPCRLLEPNGRGVFLINRLMDEVCYNQTGNQVEMFRRARREENTTDSSGPVDR